MPINAQQIRNLIVIPTLEKLGMHSESATELLLGTMATESNFGTFIKQIGKGPALGIFQMEPATHDDIRDNFLKHRQSICNTILHEFNYANFVASRLVYDMQYATIMTRLHYLRVPEALPSANNLPALAAYWKQFYNTRFGKGDEDDFIKNYNRFVKRG